MLMKYDDIREFAELMKEMGLTSLAYRNGEESINLTRREESRSVPLREAVSAKAAERSEASESGDAFVVKSPMVGVFYEAPGEGEKPYVALGEKVSVGDVLCVIEAMKIMNEITAERDGVIAEICAENKQVVEFGQTLFHISAPESLRE